MNLKFVGIVKNGVCLIDSKKESVQCDYIRDLFSKPNQIVSVFKF